VEVGWRRQRPGQARVGGEHRGTASTGAVPTSAQGSGTEAAERRPKQERVEPSRKVAEGDDEAGRKGRLFLFSFPAAQ